MFLRIFQNSIFFKSSLEILCFYRAQGSVLIKFIIKVNIYKIIVTKASDGSDIWKTIFSKYWLLSYVDILQSDIAIRIFKIKLIGNIFSKRFGYLGKSNVRMYPFYFIYLFIFVLGVEIYDPKKGCDYEIYTCAVYKISILCFHVMFSCWMY